MPEAHLKAKVSAETNDFQKAMKEASESTKKLSEDFESLKETGMRMIEIAGVFEIMRAGYEKFEAVIEKAEGLVNLASRTGIATAELMKLQAAFDLSGAGADSLAGTISRMQRTIVESATSGKDKFMELGLSAQALEKMAPDKGFELIGERIKAIKDPAQQAAAAIEIFGKEGAELLTLFKGNDLEEASQWLGKTPELMEQYGETFKGVADDLKGIGEKIEGFYTGFAAPIAQVIGPLLESFKSIDLTTFGENLGTIIASPIAFFRNAFEDGKLGLAFGEALELGSAMGMNKLLWGIEAAENVLGVTFQNAFSIGKNTEWVKGFAEIITGAAGAFGAGMMEAVRIPVEFLQWGIEKGTAYLENGLLTAIHGLVDVVTALGKAVNYTTGANLIDLDALHAGMTKVDKAAWPVIQGGENQTFGQYQDTHKSDWLLGTNPGAIAQKSGETYFDGVHTVAPVVQAFDKQAAAAIAATPAVHTFDDDSSHYKTIGDKAMWKMPGLKIGNDSHGSGEGAGTSFGLGGQSNMLKGITSDSRGGFKVFGGTSSTAAAVGGKDSPNVGKDPATMMADVLKLLTDISTVTKQAWA